MRFFVSKAFLVSFFFCIFVGNFKRVKRLRTQGNALKRDFRMENRRFESNE